MVINDEWGIGFVTGRPYISFGMIGEGWFKVSLLLFCGAWISAWEWLHPRPLGIRVCGFLKPAGCISYDPSDMER